MANKEKILLGQSLLEKKIITSEQLEAALRQQVQTKELLGVILVKLGFVDDETVLLPVLAEQLGVEFVHLRELQVPPEIIRRIPSKFAIHYKIIPVANQDGFLKVASAHPLSIEIMDGVGLVVTDKIRLVLAGEKDILEAIRKYYGVGAETIDRIRDAAPVVMMSATTIEDITQIESEASIGMFVNQILLQAYRDRATDIHIEPYEADLKIRYRVDGILADAQLPGNIWQFKDSINSRIKIMSNLNIAEKRLPQDGRFKVRLGEVDLDLRVSFLPTPWGESVVIRLLNSSRLYDMQELGLSSENLAILEELITKPHGVIFLTGPTGSGKTTTLYSCLAHVNQIDRKIITIEDPIEYQLKGVTQIQINPGIGLTFAAGLRSMLRHDPDIMMVGEVRDLETAEIAIQVALTGHLVFSTLHTNDAASGITRLIDMGVEPYLVSSAVECFIAQRLVRKICAKCKAPMKMTPEMLRNFGLKSSDIEGVTIFEGKGCETCQKTGYRGRQAIYEFLVLTDEIKAMVMARRSAAEIKEKAVQLGMRSLLQDGWARVAQGATTPGEIIRVAKEDMVG